MTESGQAVLAPPFEAVRLLKRGHGIDTWLAREREGGLPVVVKTAPASTLSAAVLRRLELEASRGGEGRSVAGTAVRATLGTYRGVSYLVLPYVPGVSLDQRLAAGPLEVDAAIGMARDLLSSLREIHEANAVHGDVKPGNIIVSEVGPLGRATLIDFAFSRSVVGGGFDAWQRVVGIILYSVIVVVQSVSCDARVLTHRSGYLAAAYQLPYFRLQTTRIGQHVDPT